MTPREIEREALFKRYQQNIVYYEKDEKDIDKILKEKFNELYDAGKAYNFLALNGISYSWVDGSLILDTKTNRKKGAV